MSNALITPTIIAKEAIMQLDNSLVYGNNVHRGYENEFGASVNGNKVGSSVTIRRPVQFTVRQGATANIQDVTEGTTTMTVDKQRGVDFKFTSSDMTLSVSEFSERYIKPAMIQIANEVDKDIAALYKDVYNWAGTPGQTINSYVDFAKGPERLDLGAVEQSGRMAILSPTDHWGLAGSFSGLYIDKTAKTALEQAKLGMVGGCELFMSQNVQTHTVGAHGGTPLTRGASQGVAYSTVKTTMTQTLATDGWTTNSGLKAGDVFTINDVYDVNPVTKATLPHLKQFSIQADLTTNTTSSNQTTLTIYPALITTGPYQNVSADNGNDKTITMMGTASTNYAQNLLFHKSAIALAMVPLQQAESGSGVAQSTIRHKGLSLQYSAQYSIVEAKMIYRFDALWGVDVVDRRQGLRLSGTA